MRAPATIDASSLAIESDASASAVASAQADRPPQLRASGRAFAQISQFHPELTAFRRDLHAHPELGFEEVYTSNRVAHALKLCGVDEVHTGIAKTGVVAVIRGQQSGTHCRELLKAGYTAAKLSGGVSSWKADNLPLVK